MHALAVIVATMFVVPLPVAADATKEQKEQAHKARLAAYIAKLLPDEQKLLTELVAKMESATEETRYGVVETAMIRRHWSALDCDRSRQALLKMAAASGFSQFCKDVKLPDRARPDAVVEYLIKTESRLPVYVAANRIAKQIAAKGFDALSEPEKQYARSHRILFQGVLPK